MKTLEVDPQRDVNSIAKAVFADKEWMGKTGVGGLFTGLAIVLCFAHLLCLPLVVACWAVLCGYILRVMRRGSDGKLPDWNSWGDLFLSGITWIALQFCIWGALGLLAFLAVALACAKAASSVSAGQVVFWVACGTVPAAVLVVAAGLLSAYVMVHFALEENARAGLAYPSTFRAVLRSPAHYLAGYLLFVGIQWAGIVVPILTVVGVFLIPSTFFITQVVAGAVLAAYWRAGGNLAGAAKPGS